MLVLVVVVSLFLHLVMVVLEGVYEVEVVLAFLYCFGHYHQLVDDDG